MKRKVFYYTHSRTELLQAKSNDIVKGFNWFINYFLANMRHDINDYHEKWYKEALELAKKLNVKRKLPFRFKLGRLKTVLNYLIG